MLKQKGCEYCSFKLCHKDQDDSKAAEGESWVTPIHILLGFWRPSW